MSKAIKNEVRRILWEEWDPIGVREWGGPDDEYDAYVNGITQAILEGRDELALTQYLTRVRTIAMGLSSTDPEIDRSVAQQLIALRHSKGV